jgi:hypothetical protein
LKEDKNKENKDEVKQKEEGDYNKSSIDQLTKMDLLIASKEL